MVSKKSGLNKVNNDKSITTVVKKKKKPITKSKTLQSIDPKYTVVDESIERQVITTDKASNVIGIKNVAGKSKEQISKIFQKRPYWSINQMPYDWLYQKVVNYFNSITVDVTDKDTGEVIAYKYSCTPTIADLATSIGVDAITLRNYSVGIQFKSDTKPYTLNDLNYDVNDLSAYANKDVLSNCNNLVQEEKNPNGVGAQSFRYRGLTKKQREELAAENASKFLLIRTAYQMIEGFHEARLGTDEKVNGSIFALINMNRGWKQEQKIVQEIGEESLGKIKSIDELNDKLKGIELLMENEKRGKDKVVETYQSDDGSYNIK